jgi:hypothetical protein
MRSQVTEGFTPRIRFTGQRSVLHGHVRPDVRLSEGSTRIFSSKSQPQSWKHGQRLTALHGGCV